MVEIKQDESGFQDYSGDLVKLRKLFQKECADVTTNEGNVLHNKLEKGKEASIWKPKGNPHLNL